jgi:hypothetical protein
LVGAGVSVGAGVLVGAGVGVGVAAGPPQAARTAITSRPTTIRLIRLCRHIAIHFLTLTAVLAQQARFMSGAVRINSANKMRRLVKMP